MSRFDLVRSEALDLLLEVERALRTTHRDAEAETVELAHEQLLAGRVTAAVIGEFKRGKSSFVSAFVEDTGLFPVDVDIATGVVTTIENATEEEVLVVSGSPPATSTQRITRDQIADFVTERDNPGNVRRARLVSIRTPSPRLRDGLVLVDTPGAGGLNTEHTAVTLGFLGNADIAIMVIDALTPMTTAELTMLKTAVRLGARPLLLVTKSDLVADHAAIEANASLKLVGALGREAGEAVPIVLVSSVAKLDWLDSRDPDDLADSNFEEVDAVLWSVLGEEGGGLLLARALSRTLGALDQVTGLLRAEIVGRGRDGTAIEAADHRLRAERADLDALADAGASWRSTLVDAFVLVRDDATGELASRFSDIVSRAEERLAARSAARDEQTLLVDLERDVTVLWTELVQTARSRVARLSDEIEAQSGLSVNAGFSQAGRLTAFATFGRARTGDDAAPQVSGLQALGFVGEVLGWVIGFDPISWIGDLVMVVGAGRARANQRRERFAEDVRDQLGRAERELQARIVDLVDDAERAVTTSYDELIRERRTHTEAVQQVLAGRELPSVGTRPAEVELETLATFRGRLVELAEQVSPAATGAR